MSVNKNTNGSIMIAALIMALITGSLVGLFLKTVTSEIEYAHRARMAFQATNLAEAGLETAIYALNKDNWNNWKAGSDGYYRDTYNQTTDWLYVSYSFRGEQRHFRTYIEPNPAAVGSTEPPKAISEGIITLGNGTTIRRQVYIELGNRSLWANGLLAKESIIFNGNGIMIDSYKSSKPAPYNPLTNRNDNGTVASISVQPDIVTSGNADIFGKVATGGDMENKNPPDVGPNGSIRGLNDKNNYVDPNRIAYDFEADLPDPTMPTLYSPLYTATKGLGSAGKTTYYDLTGFSVTSKDLDSDLTDYDPTTGLEDDETAYTVEGHVVMYVDGDVDIKGMIKLKKDASIEFHVTGDFVIAGNSSSIVNPTSDPTSLIVYGLGKDDPATVTDETPEFILAGNGTFYGAVYAPNTDVELGGSGNSGEMFGAVVAETITFGGGYQFHYDEDLAGYESKLRMKVTKWAELTDATERKNMDTILSDGL